MTYSKYLNNGNALIGFNKIKFEPASVETCQDFLTFLYDTNNVLIAVITTNKKPQLKLDWKSEYKRTNKTTYYFKLA